MNRYLDVALRGQTLQLTTTDYLRESGTNKIKQFPNTNFCTLDAVRGTERFLFESLDRRGRKDSEQEPSVEMPVSSLNSYLPQLPSFFLLRAGTSTVTFDVLANDDVLSRENYDNGLSAQKRLRHALGNSCRWGSVLLLHSGKDPSM